MEPFCQLFFQQYGEAMLKEMGCGFDGEALQRELRKFLPDEDLRFRTEMLAFDCYFCWASGAFEAGLRLGLCLA